MEYKQLWVQSQANVCLNQQQQQQQQQQQHKPNWNELDNYVAGDVRHESDHVFFQSTLTEKK